jgi:hypothetical protein
MDRLDSSFMEDALQQEEKGYNEQCFRDKDTYALPASMKRSAKTAF